MSQQAANAVQSHWVADLVVGLAGAASAVAVAQAALPSHAAPNGPTLRAIHQVSAAPAKAPRFVYGEPVAGYEVVSPFGLRKLPWETAGRLHAGADIAAPFGYPVEAVAQGVVTRVGVDGGYGRFVEIRHGQGLTSVYAHLGAVAKGLKAGDAVRIGQRIGEVGSSGASTGAHLHFEIRDRMRRPLNPVLFIDRAFATARDLPLKQAAAIPRGVRIAYVSYIPQKKRELMAAQEASRAARDAEAVQLAALDAGSIAAVPQIARPAPIRADAPRPSRAFRPQDWVVKDEPSDWTTPASTGWDRPEQDWSARAEPGWGG